MQRYIIKSWHAIGSQAQNKGQEPSFARDTN